MGIVTSPRGLSGSCRRFRISKASTKAVMPGLTRHPYQIAVCGSGCLRIYLVLKDWVGMPADLPGFERLPREFVFQWRKVPQDKAMDSGLRRNDGGVWMASPRGLCGTSLCRTPPAGPVACLRGQRAGARCPKSLPAILSNRSRWIVELNLILE